MKKQAVAAIAGIGLMTGGIPAQENPEPAPHVRPLASSADDAAAMAQVERRLWRQAYKGPRLTDMHMASLNSHYMDVLDRWIQFTQRDKEEAFRKLAPDIHQFQAYSKHGNVLACGVVATAGNNMQTKNGGFGIPLPNTEVKEPRYAEADFAFGMPGGAVVMSTRGPKLRISFPDATGDIAFQPTDMKKAYTVLTTLEPEQPNEKLFLPVYPPEAKKDYTADALEMDTRSLGHINVVTAPGVKVDISGVQGSTANPVVIHAMGNANYILGPQMRHVRVVFDMPAPEGVQEEGVVVVSPAMARRLKVQQDYVEGVPDADGLRTHSSTVTLRDEQADVEIVFAGSQLSGPGLAGGKMASLSGALVIANGREKQHIALMREGMLENGTYERKVGTDAIESQPLNRQIVDACDTLGGKGGPHR